jgi:putative transcriptional regulator
MKKETVEALLGSVREGRAIPCGQKKPSRRIVIGSSGVRAIRERTSLSQSEFADLIGVSIKTLQNWEQDRRRPTGPAAAAVEHHRPRASVGSEGDSSGVVSETSIRTMCFQLLRSPDYFSLFPQLVRSHGVPALDASARPKAVEPNES